MRTKLRSALKAIRASLDAKDLSGAKAALSQTVSIVDKMATKGIIHRNTAGRYKSRLGCPRPVRPEPARSARSPAAASRPRRNPAGSPEPVARRPGLDDRQART